MSLENLLTMQVYTDAVEQTMQCVRVTFQVSIGPSKCMCRARLRANLSTDRQTDLDTRFPNGNSQIPAVSMYLR